MRLLNLKWRWGLYSSCFQDGGVLNIKGPRIHSRLYRAQWHVRNTGLCSAWRLAAYEKLKVRRYWNLKEEALDRSLKNSLCKRVWTCWEPDYVIVIIIVIVITIIIIIIIIISFMQGIYTYIPETNHVPREYNVSAILSLIFMVLIWPVPALARLYFYVSTFRSMCAVANVAVFCSSLTLWFPGILLMHFLNDFEMVPVAPIISDVTLVFTFNMLCISVVRSLYFKIFSASFLITFLSPDIATSINIHVLASLSRIIMSGLLLGMVLSVCTCWFHNMVTLPPLLVSADFGTCSYQFFWSSCTPVSLHMLKCSWAHTLSCLFVYLPV